MKFLKLFSEARKNVEAKFLTDISTIQFLVNYELRLSTSGRRLWVLITC